MSFQLEGTTPAVRKSSSCKKKKKKVVEEEMTTFFSFFFLFRMRRETREKRKKYNSFSTKAEIFLLFVSQRKALCKKSKQKYIHRFGGERKGFQVLGGTHCVTDPKLMSIMNSKACAPEGA
jgi:hypothetical protein